MSISFNEVPQTRVPFLYAEFDNSNAVQGASQQPHTVLIVGQKLAAGTTAELELTTVLNEADARAKFGAGSHLHHMVASYREIDKLTQVKCVAIDDLLAGVARIVEYTFGAQSITADGIFYLYLGGRRYQIGITTAMTAAQVVAAAIAEINADDLRVFEASEGASASVLRLTARHKGTVANMYDYRINHYESDKYPAGFVAPSVAQTVAGSGDPDVAEIISMLPDEQYNYVVIPWVDATNLGKIRTEFESRNNATRMIESMGVTAAKNTYGDQVTFGESRNDRFLTIMDALGADLTIRWAAAYAARLCQSAKLDPARPFQTLTLPNILAPKTSELRSFEEKDLLLFAGISVANVSSAGQVSIGRAITSYRLNAQGGTDVSYLDVTTYATLSYIRFDFRNSFLAKYPRHKLADDGNVYASGQPVMTPKVGRGFAINKFQQWQELALVENIDQFVDDLIVERNSVDVNRLDFVLAPDIINQMMVAGVKIAFLL
jgi:phage tail sheath gpL-like